MIIDRDFWDAFRGTVAERLDSKFGLRHQCYERDISSIVVSPGSRERRCSSANREAVYLPQYFRSTFADMVQPRANALRLEGSKQDRIRAATEEQRYPAAELVIPTSVRTRKHERRNRPCNQNCTGSSLFLSCSRYFGLTPHRFIPTVALDDQTPPPARVL